jgi:nicotinamide riboside transporter PnuC
MFTFYVDQVKYIMDRVSAPIIFSVKSIWSDLCAFNWWQRIIIILFILISITFSIVDFNYFIFPDKTKYLFLWNNVDIDLWRRVIGLCSGIVSFAGVLYVVLVTMGRTSAYIMGILFTIFFGTYNLAYGYIGQAQIYLLFIFPLQIYGMYTWYANIDQENRVIPRQLNWKQRVGIVVLFGIISVVFFF